MKNKLYVGNLSYATSEDQLKVFFEDKGRKVIDVYMPRDRETGNPRGFAFVELDAGDDVTTAIADLNGQDLGGRALRINEAREPAGGGRGGGAGRRPSGPPRNGGPRGRN